MSSANVIGGLEGGATKSTLTLFNVADMKPLSTVDGPSTNAFQIGIKETCVRIRHIVTAALEKAGLEQNTELKSLGLSLSGLEREETKRDIVDTLKKSYPGLSHEYVAMSDTMGTLFSACANGGAVLIAGTGSNGLLINPDSSTVRCGGWGHLVGDEGSASWVSFKAVKIYFDHTDNREPAPFPVEAVERVIFDYFSISDRADLLVHLYERWEKAFFAGLCRHLAEAANKGDRLCSWLFEETGRQLATTLAAMVPAASPELLGRPEGLPVVCIGSVWKSWSLMAGGFMRELRARAKGKLTTVQLLTLKTGAPIGAAYLAADEAGLKIAKDYEKNYDVFYQETL